MDLEPERRASAPAVPRSATKGSESVLIVEDEATLRRLIRAALERGGYTVYDAPDALAALSLAGELRGPLDLLLTDITLPGCSGPELASRLAAARPETRVLFMSGYFERAAGSSNVLPADSQLLEKPFTLAALIERVQEILERTT